VRDWFAANVPKLAGAVAGLVVHPVVGKLVEAAGDAVVGEFKQLRKRLSTPRPCGNGVAISPQSCGRETAMSVLHRGSGELTTAQEVTMSAATEIAAPPASMRAAGHSDGRIARLVQRAALDDRDAWSELVQEFEGMLRAITRAHRLSEADSADVAQNAWLRLVQNLDRLEDPSHVGAWLATTTRRECLRKLRASAQELPEDDCREPLHGETPPVDDHLLEAERDATLWSAFGRLPSRDQALLRMLMADPQPSYEEIGAAMEMPIGSIGPTRRRALGRLLVELGSGEALGELVAC